MLILEDYSALNNVKDLKGQKYNKCKQYEYYMKTYQNIIQVYLL